MTSMILGFQLRGVDSDGQQLRRSTYSSLPGSGAHATRFLGRPVSSCEVRLPPLSIIFEQTRASHKREIVAHLRADAAGSNGEGWTLRAPESDWAAGQSSLIGIRCRFAALTTLAIGLSLLLHHETASSAVATFLWEKPQELVQPEPSKGSCATCIGVVDETLGTCNSTLNCISSFDDRPKFFVAPWEFPGLLPDALKKLKEILLSMGADLVAEPEERYIHAMFTNKADGVIDDVEFLFSKPSEDATVVVRAASRAQGVADNDRNRRRLEKIRSTLTWEQVPILRNRKRALFFLESPWDSFGPEPPPTYDYDEGLEFVPE